MKAARLSDGEKGHPLLTIPEPLAKPRDRHWTVLSDRCLPLGLQREVLDITEDIIDHVKIVDHVGHMERWSLEFMNEKLRLYKDRGFGVFPGGIPFEIAYLQDKVDEYFARLSEIGFSGVEIADDTLPTFSFEERTSIIKRAASFGLEVFSETGNKFGAGPTRPEDIIDCVKNDLDAGSTKVTVENADMILYLDQEPDSIMRIVEECGIENILFEVGPNGWPELAVFLFNEVGPEVNIENVEWDKIIQLEAMRRGLNRAVGFPFLTKYHD